MIDQSDLAIAVDLTTNLSSSEQQVRDARSGEGFGVLTEIDVQATLKSKLGVDTPGSGFLGICNPPWHTPPPPQTPAWVSSRPATSCSARTGAVPRASSSPDLMTVLRLVDRRAVAEVASEARDRICGWRNSSLPLTIRPPTAPSRRGAMDPRSWNDRNSTAHGIWSAAPNQFIKTEAEGLAPGRALDLGTGEGRNAIWLAERGWHVTAVDWRPPPPDHTLTDFALTR